MKTISDMFRQHDDGTWRPVKHLQLITRPQHRGDQMPPIDVWATIADPDIPHDVVERLVDRQAAVRDGRQPEPVPEDDKPWLARHIVHQCAEHDELIRHSDHGWTHLSDGRECPPAAEQAVAGEAT